MPLNTTFIRLSVDYGVLRFAALRQPADRLPPRPSLLVLLESRSPSFRSGLLRIAIAKGGLPSNRVVIADLIRNLLKP